MEYLESKKIDFIFNSFNFYNALNSYPKKNWQKFVNNENTSLCNDEAFDLLSKMLIYDHAERITPKEAMDHPYFEPVRQFHLNNPK